MPGKGEIYNKVGIRLDRWLVVTMRKLGRSKAEMARLMHLNRGRISQMAKGELNTEKYVHVAVHCIESSNYLSMLPYVENEDAEHWLRQQDLIQHQSPEERKKTRILLERFYKMLREKRFQDLKGSFDELEGFVKAKRKK